MSRQVRTRARTRVDALASAVTHFDAAVTALKEIRLNACPIALREPVQEARAAALDGREAAVEAIRLDVAPLQSVG